MARPRGNRWQADVNLDGKRVRKSFRTQQEALDFESFPHYSGSSISKTVWSRQKPKVVRNVFTLKGFSTDQFDMIWGENREPEFIRGQLRAVYRVLGETTSIAQIDTNAVDFAIKKWRQEGLAAATINHRLSVLSKLLKYAARRGVIRELPFFQRQRVSNLLERTWSSDDEAAAFLYLDHIGLTPTRMILQFLLYTGARKGEAYALKRSSVSSQWVRFDRRTTKNGQTREIPLVRQASEAWDKLCLLSELERPLAIIPQDTLRGHWELLRSHFNAIDDRAFVPHMLRHTCATRLVAGGVPLAQVMKWMGHQSIQVTMRYVFVAPRDLAFAASVLSGEAAADISFTNNAYKAANIAY